MGHRSQFEHVRIAIGLKYLIAIGMISRSSSLSNKVMENLVCKRKKIKDDEMIASNSQKMRENQVILT